ncbi:bifunctional hydroxymethylpyrimidine kinase/phosphomethylpyrimidine kinase [Asticcacaulis sp. EMRT-3]|uniref:bifunctional hydroxymethylpyrimidine kinase/phosphomethylpyrimidine kinase n=1 Tax=Asticcacaulis sp. EMRT-3 TaxID=3040349 RepID=UPI0024AFA25D|nr:bifunctional hydroxymethylpyrimidine kinase/phosphomethylpyrimidine kinase [Asticcacaulis sp. EMRT-3]MDI7773738.1 bifunctional hydroxymethylpyrimidine kinase/phosphomethylpyrimidine kinase [Asticcacaulis sp. EMRT-3]
MHRVLIIAGSDSSGGAGIQADIKTVTCLGGYAMTAITALTVQNTLGVSDVMAVPPDFIRAQARACLDDIGADAIKTGMLGDVATLEVVSEVIEGARLFTVVDPVMVAKGGHALLADQAVDAMKALLVPLADLLTPNVPEAHALTGLAIDSEDDMRAAGEALLQMGAKNVLMKGGHMPGDEVVDWLVTPKQTFRFAGPRIDTRHTHGTGCTLASACAALMREGRPLDEAVGLAKDYIGGAILMAPGLGQGHGPLRHNWLL